MYTYEITRSVSTALHRDDIIVGEGGNISINGCLIPENISYSTTEEGIVQFYVSTGTGSSPISILKIEKAFSSKIFLNNVLLHRDINYTILENDMVQFYMAIEEYDSVTVKRTIAAQIPLFSKNNPKTPYQFYSSFDFLDNNSKYQLILKLKNQEFPLQFSSKLSPSYLPNAVMTLENDIGEIAKSFTPKEIAFAVHMASKDFDQKLLLADYTDDIPEESLPLREKWVRYKSTLDLLNNAYLTKVKEAGKQSKKVGNLEISKDHKIPYYSDMMRRAQSMFDEVDKEINSTLFGSSIFGTFTKAGSTAYPLIERLW